MAEIRSFDIRDDDFYITLKISKNQYRILQSTTTDIILLPADDSLFNNMLTTGRLGNSNRIMVPGKLLRDASITELDKKVPSMIFTLENQKYLLIKLENNNIPDFKKS